MSFRELKVVSKAESQAGTAGLLAGPRRRHRRGLSSAAALARRCSPSASGVGRGDSPAPAGGSADPLHRRAAAGTPVRISGRGILRRRHDRAADRHAGQCPTAAGDLADVGHALQGEPQTRFGYRPRTAGRCDLEGTVAQTGPDVRISARLVRGATGEIMWAQSFERPRRHVLALQSAVAQAVTSTLHVASTVTRTGAACQCARHRPGGPPRRAVGPPSHRQGDGGGIPASRAALRGCDRARARQRHRARRPGGSLYRAVGFLCGPAGGHAEGETGSRAGATRRRRDCRGPRRPGVRPPGLRLGRARRRKGPAARPRSQSDAGHRPHELCGLPDHAGAP